MFVCMRICSRYVIYIGGRYMVGHITTPLVAVQGNSAHKLNEDESQTF